ncbi:hypothetical protein ACNI3K_01700 [Demequina sp. SO4-13]|uniref:hypothetical protein n=1 Tax=Demequina sp. SO4-13 TaxID=3401027 RepID=UPI003AF7FA0F
MAPPRPNAEHRGALEHLADELAHDADSFTPEVESVNADLPGRRRGAASASDQRPGTGAAAVLLDIGTSRHEGYTHVLWVSASAESQLGSGVFEGLGDRLGQIRGVRGYEWEGLDHLHLRAPGRDHTSLLEDARRVVANLLG